MPETFDPYYTWLGIPPNEQPADHYRLLGIRRFEENREVISHAADQRMAHVRSFQTGPAARDSQRVLNELSKAAGCLLNPRRKAMYDQHLQSASVTSRAEEARLPPQKIAVDAVDAQVPAIRTGAKPPARSKPVPRRTRQLRFALGGLGAVLLVGAVVIWMMSGGPAPTPTVSSSSPSTSPDAPGNAAAVASIETLPGRRSAPGANSSSSDTTKVVEEPSVISSESPTTIPPSGSTGTDRKVATDPAKTSLADPPAVKPPSSAPPTVSTAETKAPSNTEVGPTADPEIPVGRPKALRFGGSDRVELANSRGLIDFTKPFTVETWVRFAPGGSAHWITGDFIIGPNHPEVPSNSVAGWQLFIQQTQNNRHRVAFSTRNGYASDFPEKENTWHHIAACSDASQLTVYVDGRRSANGKLDLLQKSFAPSPIPIHLGSHGYLHTNQPPGLTGDVQAFRLSSACRYSATFEPASSWAKDADTLVLLDFANSTGKEVSDISGHGRHGVVYGARWVAADVPSSTAVAAATSAPVTKPGVSPPSTAVPPSKTETVRPIPDEVSLVKAREQMRKVLKDDFEKAKDSKQLLALADKLLALAADSQEDPAGQFAMLEQAHQLAAKAGELSRSLAMIEDFAKKFAIDAPMAKIAAVTMSADAAKVPADRRRVAEAAIGLLDELVMLGRFDSASEIAQAAVTAAARAKDSDLGKTAREYRDEIGQAKRRWTEAREVESQLATDQENGDLNLGWGRFVCFYQRNWAKGLPHLARGSLPALAATAKLDLANPTSPDEQTAVARSWSELMKTVEAAERPAVALRALHWYRQAEPQLKGLAKVDAEKQVKELESALPGRYRSAASKSAKPTGMPAFQPPKEYIGALGRIQVNGIDAGVLWKYDAGMRLTNQSVFDVLNQAGVPRGMIRIEFAGLVHLNESMTVHISQSGGSPTATAALMVDNKLLGEVGGMRANSDVYKVELNAGEHTVRWVISGEDLGNCSFAISNPVTAQQLPLYHNQPLLTLIRENPSRARLNVNMTRN
jgi:hypothetical protein